MTFDRFTSYLAAALAAAAIALAAAGCSGVKNCAAPQIAYPQAVTDAAAIDSMAISDISWAEFYADPNLSALIEKALAHNRNLLSAKAKVEQMEALYGVSKANQLPDLEFQVGGNHETNDYRGNGRIDDPEVDIKVRLNWEIDFWGRLKWAKSKARYDYFETENARRAMEMTIVAQVADTYFRLVALDNELAIVRRTITTRRESMELAKLRYDGGLTAETVYQQAKVEYATAATMVPAIEGRISATANKLAVLTGQFPGTPVIRGLIDAEVYVPDTTAIVVSTRLLERRPDLMGAENRLRSAMAKVGIAYANRFPQINITLGAGIENDGFVKLFKAPFSYLGGFVTGPLLGMGRLKRQYKAALAEYDASRYAYEQTVLEVFGEAADASKNYTEARRTTVLRAELRDAAAKYVELATLQYRGGSISYLDVLDAQRRYFDAQVGLSNAIRDENLALVQLYRSLGGGWTRQQP